MTSRTAPTILMVPGLRDHVAEHWQTLLESKLPKAASVPPLEHDKLSCAARVAALAKIERPEAMAKDWGSCLVDLGEVGHLNPAAGLVNGPCRRM